LKNRIGIISKFLLAVAFITAFTKLYSMDIGFPQETIRELEQNVFIDQIETMSTDESNDNFAAFEQSYSGITESKTSHGGLMLADYEGLPIH
jgi:hypothetical protein